MLKLMPFMRKPIKEKRNNFSLVYVEAIEDSEEVNLLVEQGLFKYACWRDLTYRC